MRLHMTFPLVYCCIMIPAVCTLLDVRVVVQLLVPQRLDYEVDVDRPAVPSFT